MKNKAPDTNTSIFIDALELWIKIGVTEDERLLPQRVLFTANFGVNLRPKTFKALTDSVDYASASETVRTIANSRSWVLLEDLALTLARELFITFEALLNIEIVLAKFVLPAAAKAGVRVCLNRMDLLDAS